MTRRYLVALARVCFIILVLGAIVCVANFPYSTDAPLSSAEVGAARDYYTQIYLKPVDDRAAETDYDRKYQEIAEWAAKGARGRTRRCRGPSSVAANR